MSLSIIYDNSKNNVLYLKFSDERVNSQFNFEDDPQLVVDLNKKKEVIGMIIIFPTDFSKNEWIENKIRNLIPFEYLGKVDEAMMKLAY